MAVESAALEAIEPARWGGAEFFAESLWRALNCSILITENASMLLGEIQGFAHCGHLTLRRS